AETVAGDEPSLHSEWQDDPWTVPPRSGHNIVGLLFRVSEDNARRNAYVHRGCMCNACGLLPIRGIRYRCANCADFDLCETCESQGLHIKTHVFYKVRVPAPPFGPKSMQPVWYPGDPDTALRSLPNPLIRHLARETGFERPELEALWEQWTFIAATEWRDDPDELYLAADRKTFERYLVPSSGTKRTTPNLIHDRMFAFYDTNGDDLISFPEFLKGLSYKKGKERLERIFKGYDIDGDGYISRRDCLRMFRTYYVLYKQMHADVIEGLDQQALHNTDTQQLVTGRQPLSSHFGREGRVPEADHGRRMEGKVFHSNGEVFINDDKFNVVNETRPDVGNREEILSSLFSQGGDIDHGSRFYASTSEHVTSPTGEDVSHIHFEALLNPPTQVAELVNLLVGESRNIQPGEISPDNREEQQNSHDSGSEEDTSVEEDDTEAPRPPLEGAASGLPANASLGFSAATTNGLRDAVRKKLFDRWRKRTFYLMEEEGTSPPEGFDADEDVLADITATEGFESKDGQPALSARSRSSSKVRFAEDTDDYEVRSNPSTSSRSVPERWGGMDIPDAERDMGKEILYVVTQQAFNEILDVLFKEKEDLAVKAAQSKEWRDAYRDVLDSFDPDQPLRAPSQPTPQQSGTGDRNVDELLATAGYEVDETLAVDGTVVEREDEDEVDTSADEEDHLEETSENGSAHMMDATSYRDPTMPQFRPNCDADLRRTDTTPHSDQRQQAAEMKGFNCAQPSLNSPPPQKGRPLTRPDRSVLVEWKKLDAAEAEAKERGGWGRLTLAEFKEIWHREESGHHRLDYLGTWIDFCIP
ncbi:EF-hand, partial [Cryphonectria parasitica EP155]